MAVETRSDRIIVGRLYRAQEFGALIRLLEGPLQDVYLGQIKNAKNEEDAAKAVYKWQAFHEVLLWIQDAVAKGDISGE